MSDTQRGDDDTSDARRNDDEFDPVEVFPESEEMDLRPGSDDCYKCSTCDTSCPVAEVDDEFPGPKFQGPEQWRLKRKEDASVDESIKKCSNCMRCDEACPTGVPLSQMHNTARAEYVKEEMDFSLAYLRDRTLANYGRLAGLASTFPRATNTVMGNGAVQWLGERVFGITSERSFPTFARQTFREWWRERGGDEASKERAREARADRAEDSTSGETGESAGGETGRSADEPKRVAYFHGDYANYNTVEVAKALVRVYEHYGYAVTVPEQRCSGTPMFANGMLDDARRAARFNVETLRDLVADGMPVVCTCTSCSMALRQEYPELFDFEGVDDVAANTWDAVEFLRVHEDLAADLRESDVSFPDLAYHAPCHARNQGLAGQAVELAGELDGVAAHDVGDSCSGISGTYGWKAENYDTSMAIGEEMFEHMERVDAETGLTECPTCAMQMEHGTGYEVRHTLELLDAALVE